MPTRSGSNPRRPKSASQGGKASPTHEQRSSYSLLLKRVLPAASVQTGKDRLESFSLSKFPNDATPENYVPPVKKPAASHYATKLQHVGDFQRKRIAEHLRDLKSKTGEHSRNKSAKTTIKGITLALPKSRIAKLLPSYDEKSGEIDLDDLMSVIGKHTRGSEFFAKGDPTLNRLRLHDRVNRILGTDKRGKSK